MFLRKYEPSDCREITELFFDTVHAVNCKDYNKEQLDAWAAEKADLEQWNKSLQEHDTVVALEGKQIVGFGDMDRTGYLDRLYVHKDYQHRGAATAICRELEGSSDAVRFCTHASITAKPFFLAKGYHVQKEQQVIRNGITLTNYIMKK